MKNRLLISKLSLAAIIMTAVSCSKQDTAPDSPPVIQFNSVTKTTLTSGATKRDSVIISVRYQDADGNLGESDSSRIKQLFVNQSWGNYRVETLQLVNGSFSTLSQTSSAKLYFPSLSNQPKPLEGVLNFSQRFPYSSGLKLVPVKFRVQLRDRNLNESNVVETDTLHLPIAP